MIIAQLAYFDSNQDSEWLASFYDAETFLICKEKLEDKCDRAGGFLEELHCDTETKGVVKMIYDLKAKEGVA